MKNDVIAIVPARSGSKGVPNKNIKQLGGHPLLAWSIASAKLSGIERVIVSTDSEHYANIAIKYGAEVPFLRSKDISSDSSTCFEFMRHAMEWCEENGSDLPEYWLHLRPTTPLRDPNLIQKAVCIIRENDSLDSLRSAHEVPESPFKWFLKDDNNMFEGLREDLSPEKVNEPRQNFPKVFNPNGHIDIVKASHVLNSSNLHGDKMFVFVTPNTSEIDTSDDFEYIEYQIDKEGSPLSSFFKT